MTIPGAGGQTPPRPDQQTIPAVPVPVSPGSSGVVRARQVIVSSGGGSDGIFVYNGQGAAGNPPIFSVVAPGTVKDPFGNTVNPIMNVGSLAGAHTGFDANGVEYLSDSTGTTRILIDPQNRVIEFYDASGTGANPPLFTVASAAGNDRFTGDPFQTGAAAYAAGGFPYAQLAAGALNFQATSGQFSPGVVESFGLPGEVGITSGLATNTDNAANVIIDSAQASGSGQSLVSLQGATVQLTASGAILPSGSQTLQGSSPAAYNQAFDQGTVNRVNTIINQLKAAGITN